MSKEMSEKSGRKVEDLTRKFRFGADFGTRTWK